MFEPVVRAVLNKLLGDYVSNLETNQLNVGLFSGNVVLHGLKLKSEALDRLDLPITVHDGYLGKFELHIPWTNLKQQPVVIEISDLYLLAGVKVQMRKDCKEEAEQLYRHKLERLETSELFVLNAGVNNSEQVSKAIDEAQNESFTTQLITKIVDNLQVKIRNIHIRFEDKLSRVDGKQFSFGITLEQLSAISTNSNWDEAFITDPVDKIHKLLNLESLSVYWDSFSGHSLLGLEAEPFLDSFRRFIDNTPDKNDILMPITGCGKVIIHKKPKPHEPKTLINLFFDQLALQFDNEQYFDLLNLVNYFVAANRLNQFGDLHPVSKPEENPIEWFQYVVNSSLRKIQDENRKKSWKYVMERRADRLLYINSFLEKLQTTTSSLELLSTLEQLERKLDYEDIKFYRSVARRKFSRLLKAQKEQQAASSSSGWLSWLLSAASQAPPTTIGEMIKDEDIQELYETIDYKEGKPSSPTGSNLIFQVNFDLGTGSLNVGNYISDHSDSHVVGSLIFKLLSSSLLKRQDSIMFSVSLQELSLYEGLLEGSLFPEVIRTRSHKYDKPITMEGDQKPFFYLSYDQAPENPAADSSLSLFMQPLIVVINHQAANLFTNFFVGGRNSDLIDSLSGIASDQFSELRVWSKSSLTRALQNHKVIDLHIDIEAPVIIIPIDCTQNERFLFYGDLGHVVIKSKLVNAEQRSSFLAQQATESLSRVELRRLKDLLYDQFDIFLSQVYISYFNSYDEFNGYIECPKDDIPNSCKIVDNINLSLDIGSCILPKNSELPDVSVIGRVPSIEIHFDDVKYRSFMDLIDLFFPSKPEATHLEAVEPAPFYSQRNISSIISLPNVAFRSQIEGEEVEEFQDAVETLEDLKIREKEIYERVSVEVTFRVEKAYGHVVNKKVNGINIGDILVRNLKVLVELRPSDVFVQVLLKSFDVTDFLDKEPRKLIEGQGREGFDDAEQSEGLLKVSVSVVDNNHPLFHSKYKSAGITVDIDIYSVRLNAYSPSIMYILRYVVDTFSRANKPEPILIRGNSKLERTLSKLSKVTSLSATLKKGEISDSKIYVSTKLSLLQIFLGDEQSNVGCIDLQRAGINLSFFGSGKFLMQGKLASLMINPRSGYSFDYPNFDNIPFLIVEGSSVVDFTYETFLKDEKAFPGYETDLKLKSGSMHFVYMPAFMNDFFNFLTNLRKASNILTASANIASTVHDIDVKPSKFHYEVDIDSPQIDLRSPSNPKELLSIFPGNLAISNSFKDDPESGPFFDTFIDVAIRSVHIDIAHIYHPLVPLVKSSLIKSVDIDVRVTQAHHPFERCFPFLDIEVGSGPIKLTAGSTEYTLAISVFNWFIATYQPVIAGVNRFLAAGSEPISQSPNSPITNNVTMEVQVLVDKLEANVFQYQKGPFADSLPDACPLSNLDFTEISVKYLSREKGDYFSELAVQIVKLQDTRPDPTHAFREILKREVDNKVEYPGPMLLLRYDWLNLTRQSASKLSLDSPRALLTLDHLFALKEYFINGMPKTSLGPSNNPSPTSGESKLSEQPSMAHDYSIVVQVVHASIMVLENPKNPITEAMEVNLPQIVYTNNNGNQTLTLDDVRGAFCNMNDIAATRLDFVEPFHVIMTVAYLPASPLGTPSSSQTTVNVTPIIFRFAYQDIAVVQSLISQYTSLKTTQQITKDEDGLEAIDPLEEALREFSLESPSQTTEIVPLSSTIAQSGSSLSNTSFSLDSIRAVFVDDFSKVNRPLLEVLLNNINGDLNFGFTGEMHGISKMILSSTFYNILNSHWESLIDPIVLTADISQEVQEGFNGHAAVGTNVLISSDQGLEFNISHAFSELILRLYSSFAQAKPHELSALREFALPYMLVNKTGIPLKIWATKRQRGLITTPLRSAGEEPEKLGLVTLGIDQSLPWGFEDWRTLRSSKEACDARISCILVGSPWDSIHSIVIDHVGTSTYPLRPRIEESACQLIVSVEVKDGIKKIVFRPTIMFANASKYLLEVKLTRSEAEEARSSFIRPGETSSLPITLVSKNIRLKVRPSGLGYDFCAQEITLNASLLDIVDKKSDESKFLRGGKQYNQISCLHLSDQVLHPPYHYLVYGVLESGKHRLKVGPEGRLSNDAVMTLYFKAPLRLYNQLPYPISYRIYDKTAGFDFGGALVAGDSARLHFINLSHTIGLSIQVEPAGLMSSEISIINTTDWDSRDQTLPMIDSERIRMELMLEYSITAGRVRKVSICAPYIIYNLFHISFGIKNNTIVKAIRDIAGVAKLNEVLALKNKTQPLLFSYPESIALRDRVRIRIGDSEWSPPVSMETVGATDMFDLHDSMTDSWYNVSMTVRLGPVNYSTCKIVHFGPRYIFVNSTKVSLAIGERGRLESCPPNFKSPFNIRPELRGAVSLGILDDDHLSNAGYYRTATFDIDELGKVFMKVPKDRIPTGLLRIDRILQGQFIFVQVREEAVWPYVLINKSSFELVYSQTSKSPSVAFGESVLLPEETVNFTWDEPGAEEKKLLITAGNKKIPINIHDIGQLQPIAVKLPGGIKRSLSIDVIADGPVLKVLFADFDSAKSIYKYRRRFSSLSSSTAVLGSEAGDDAFEVKSVESILTSMFRIKFPSIGITLINRHFEEIIYIYAKDLEFRYGISNLHFTYGLTIGWLQIDNQLFGDWDHPILLYPAVLSKKSSYNRNDEDSTPAFLSIALIQSQDCAHGVTYFKYFGFLMQEVVVDLGEHLINKLVDFGQFDSIEPSPDQLSLVLPSDTCIPDLNTLDSRSSILYFELFQLHPIKVSLSFSKIEGKQYDEIEAFYQISGSGDEESYNPLMAIANVFTTTLGSFSDAPLKFNALLLEHPIIRQSVLFSLIKSHYSQQAINQVHRIIGAVDFIGNPVGLFSNFGSGVSDFFYEPFLGLVSDKPGDMGIGLAKGSISLVRKTVVGLTETFSKLTGSMSKGFSVATFDPSFQQKRRLIHSRNRPKHAISGLTAGAKHLFTGLTSGITGIVEKPVEGAIEGGVAGFFKGIGVGLVGIVTKPVVGVLDATTSVTEGIKNTADPDAVDLVQVRLPRPIPYDEVLRPYSEHEARGQSILYALHLREHETPTGFSFALAAGREFYVAHLDVPADEAIILVTTLAIILVEAEAFKEIWRVPLEELVHVRPHRDVILLVVRQEAVRQRMIFVADPVLQEWFCNRVEDAMTIYNEQRRSFDS